MKRPRRVRRPVETAALAAVRPAPPVPQDVWFELALTTRRRRDWRGFRLVVCRIARDADRL